MIARKIALTLLSWLSCFFVAHPSQAHEHAQSFQGWAVLVVDVQACFVAGGRLAVPGADKAYIEEVNKATDFFKHRGFLLVASRDYHPPNHVSFASNHPGSVPFTTIQLPDGRTEKLWPDHCVYTYGDSRLMLDTELFFEAVKKGQNPQYDSYSAFRDEGGAETELNAILKAKQIKNIVVYGLATDFCVKASVMDALMRGYSVHVLVDLSRGVSSTETEKAIGEMRSAGAKIIRGAPYRPDGPGNTAIAQQYRP